MRVEEGDSTCSCGLWEWTEVCSSPNWMLSQYSGRLKPGAVTSYQWTATGPGRTASFPSKAARQGETTWNGDGAAPLFPLQCRCADVKLAGDQIWGFDMGGRKVRKDPLARFQWREIFTKNVKKFKTEGKFSPSLTCLN